ncbi:MULTISPECIES: BA14K family protein [unclassified Xanthobacter]|uniref:BA14K family protein n=1 Tax=unclassified Xanthobacter TaxID=2623496 RepID=UPI001EDDAAD0|nr:MULTISPECIES: BA14K family protein [unclassified Xanthobacter]
MQKKTASAVGIASKAMVWTLVAGLSAGGVTMSASQAVAQGLASGMATMGDRQADVTQVQGPPPGRYRPGPRPGWNRPPPPPPHGRWGNPYWRNGGWYYRNNSGAWIAAGVAGIALGAAAAAAAQNAQNQRDAVAYCMQRYRSYDPRTGTYLGYDGYRHPCP